MPLSKDHPVRVFWTSGPLRWKNRIEDAFSCPFDSYNEFGARSKNSFLDRETGKKGIFRCEKPKFSSHGGIVELGNLILDKKTGLGFNFGQDSKSHLDLRNLWIQF
jgi:hypothetical protein